MMKTLDASTVAEIDWFAGSMLGGVLQPRDQVGIDRRNRLEANSADLNLLTMDVDPRHGPVAPGLEQAYAIVSTDIAMRVSADLVAADRAGELPGLAASQIDPGVAFDPWNADTPVGKATVPLATDPTRERPDASAPVPAGNATRLAQATRRAFPEAVRESETPQTRRAATRLVTFADRIERTDRQRGMSTDPDAKAAYDVVSSDLGARLAIALKDGLEGGSIHPSRLTKEDFAVISDPRTPVRTTLLDQAGRVAGGEIEETGAKGPRIQETPVPVIDRGAGR